MALWMLQNYITNKNSYRLVSGKGTRPARTKLSKGGLAGAWCWIGLVLVIAIGIPYFSIIASSLIKPVSYTHLVLISKSLQIRAIFLFFWRTTADRLYIWKLICLLCTKLTGILDIHGTVFSICLNTGRAVNLYQPRQEICASHTGRSAAICVRRTGICARAGGSWRPKRLVSSLVFRVTRGILY